jgi:hypothetical protein
MTSKANNRVKTLDGIERLGHRLAEEIKDFIREQSTVYTPKTVHLTIIGHSLGGVIGRYAIKVLFENQSQFKIDSTVVIPATYMSVASPHLGSRLSPKSVDYFGLRTGVKAKGFNLACRFALERVGKQLHLEDDLLLEMSRHEGVFMQSLRQFKRRIIVGHLYDPMVSFCTATVGSCNPPEIKPTRKKTFRVISRSDSNQEALDQVADACRGRRALECDTRIQCSKCHSELDTRMLAGMAQTPFHRILVDFGALKFYPHMNIIGDFKGPITPDIVKVTVESVNFLTALIMEDFTQ